MSSLDNLLRTRIEHSVILSDFELSICRQHLFSEERALRLAEYQEAEQGVDDGTSGESLTLSAISSAKHRAHSAKINALRNLLSPIRKLPVEILAEIFMMVYCSWEETETELSEERPMSARPPLLLTQVCAAWTKVALRLPALWTKLEFLVDDEDPNRFDHRTLLTQWLRRAGKYPLEIHCRFKLVSSTLIRDPKKIGAEIPARSIIRAIIPFLRQCQVFQLHARIASVQPLLQLNLHWPQLEVLDLNITDVPRQPLSLGLSPSSYTRTPLETFFRAPRLRYITIGGTISNVLMLPAKKITSLALRGHIVMDPEVMNRGYPQHFIDMMVHCPNITHLSISASFGRGRFHWTGIVFQRLESLEVVYELDDIDVCSPKEDLTPSFLYFLIRCNAMPALSSFSLVGKSTRATSLDACVRERVAQGKSCGQGESFPDLRMVERQARFMIKMTRTLFKELRSALELSIAATRWRASLPDGDKVQVQSNITVVEFHGVFWLSYKLFADIVEMFPQVDDFQFDDTLNKTFSILEKEVPEVLAGEDSERWQIGQKQD